MTASASGRTDSAERLLTATPERIYEAFVDAAALMARLPPQGTGRVLEPEARAGGRCWIELAYARRIKQSVEFEASDPAFAGKMMMTWSFDAAPGGTLVRVTAENVPSGISKQDHDAGLRSSLENLARFVERPSS